MIRSHTFYSQSVLLITAPYGAWEGMTTGKGQDVMVFSDESDKTDRNTFSTCIANRFRLNFYGNSILRMRR